MSADRKAAAKVEGGIEKEAKGEDELWRNAAKNAPRLDLLTHFPTLSRGHFRRGSDWTQFREKRMK